LEEGLGSFLGVKLDDQRRDILIEVLCKAGALLHS